MASNLRARFRERQRKRLSESIAVNPIPSKRACSEPAPTPMSVSVPPATATTVALELDEKLLFANDIAHHEPRRPFVGPNHFSEKSFEYMVSFLPHPKPTYVPNQKEVSKLLRQIHSFIERETPVQNMGVLFSTTQRISIKIDNDPSRSLWHDFRMTLQTPPFPILCPCRTIRLSRRHKW